MKASQINAVNNNLLTYISKNRNLTEVVSFLKNHHLITWYSDFLQQQDEKTYNLALELMKQQNDRYSYFLNEIKYIIEQSEKIGITVYFMKGIILADELFIDPAQRKSMDMDLLVEYKDLEVAHNLLLQLDYRPYGDETYTNSLSCVKKYETIREEITHITSYYKKIVVRGEEKTLYADLHIKPYHYMPVLNSEMFKSIFSRTKKVYVKLIDKDVATLGTIDTFIHLSAHFIRHYYWEYLKFLRMNNNYVFRIELLNEMALYFIAHKEELDCNELVDIAISLNQIEPVYFVLLAINHIHENCISEKTIGYAKDKFTCNAGKCGISSKFIGSMVRKDLDLQMNLEDYELANYIYHSMYETDNVGNIQKIDGDDIICEERLKSGYFNINKTEIVLEKNRKNLLSKYENDASSLVGYAWSENFLNIKIKCGRKNKPNVIRISFNKNSALSCDNEFLEVNGKNYNVFSNTLEIKLGKENAVEFFVNGKSLGKDEIIYKVLNDDIDIRIPFNLLNFKAKAGRLINLQTCLIYFEDYDEMKYLIECTRHSYDDYIPFEPWICEFTRYKLI